MLNTRSISNSFCDARRDSDGATSLGVEQFAKVAASSESSLARSARHLAKSASPSSRAFNAIARWRMARKRKPSALGMRLSFRAIFLIARLCWLVRIAPAQYYVVCLASLEERYGPTYSSAGPDRARIFQVMLPDVRRLPRRWLQGLQVG